MEHNRLSEVARSAAFDNEPSETSLTIEIIISIYFTISMLFVGILCFYAMNSTMLVICVARP